MLDMPVDSDDVAHHQARCIAPPSCSRTAATAAYHFKSLDDPRLKKLKVGVYETSAMREALAEHGVAATSRSIT